MSDLQRERERDIRVVVMAGLGESPLEVHEQYPRIHSMI